MFYKNTLFVVSAAAFVIFSEGAQANTDTHANPVQLQSQHSHQDHSGNHSSFVVPNEKMHSHEVSPFTFDPDDDDGRDDED